MALVIALWVSAALTAHGALHQVANAGNYAPRVLALTVLLDAGIVVACVLAALRLG